MTTFDAGRLPAWVRSPLVLVYAIGPVTVGLLWVLKRDHLVVNRPMWVYLVLWVVPAAVATIATLAHARHPSNLTLHARAALGAIATTVIIYPTGWGPALGVAYLVAAQQLVADTSPDSWNICRLWSFASVAGGQLAISLGLAPSYLRSPVDNGIAVLGVIAFLYVSRMAQAISADRERAWEAVRVSAERFEALVQNSSDMIVVLDEASGAMYASGACEHILGISADALLETDLESLVHPDDVEPVRACLTEALLFSGPTPPVEMRVRHADSEWRHLEAVGTNLRDDPAIGGVVLNVRDVTDRKQAEAELAHNAMHDTLTGLPNRALFLDRLHHSLKRRRPEGSHPAVLFLDIDRFKLVNDSLGHEIGDQLLIEAARRLRASVRAGDTVARFGGDEFVILCEPPGDPAALARRLLDTLERPFRLAGEDFYLSASVGVAAPDEVVSNPSELIRDADTAMYRAKELGRGRMHVFDETARAAALARVHTEHLLRGALDRGELRLFYQPIIDLRTGALVGTEALLRWQHPNLGLIGPVRFIESAEDSGLILMIGDWVLREACEQAAIWASRGSPVNMAVNVSARQLADDEFAEAVKLMLRQPLQLTLEVTESVLIRDPDATAERVDTLKGLGVRLAMDDFGTGYSSLANLRRYPFDALKIDQRFVGGLAENPDDGTIVRAIVALAHGLGRTVVAEGVETEEQLIMLRELGCDLAQGFYIGAPQVATDDPVELLAGFPQSAPLINQP